MLTATCIICNRSFSTYNGLGGHIRQTHKLTPKQYYDTYLFESNDGFCKTCGIPTRFISINKGYLNYCFKCSHNTESSKQKRRATNIEKYGVSITLLNDDIKAKTKQTMLQKYNSEYIFSTEHFKQKHKENSLLKYGTDHPMQNKQVLHNNHKYRRQYLYDNIYFDSSWELSVYIYCIDNNIHIEREPIKIKYIDSSNKLHIYYPDFIINDQIVEIKGNQFLDINGKLLDIEKQKCIDANNIEIWSYDQVKFYIEYCQLKFNNKFWYKQFKIKRIKQSKPKTIKIPKPKQNIPKIKPIKPIKDKKVNKSKKVIKLRNSKPIKQKSINTYIFTRRLTEPTANTKYDPVKCLICNKEFYNGRYLSSHLKFEEHIAGQEYYDKYLRKPNEGICIACGKPTKYINFTRGYQFTCSQQCNNSSLSNKGKLVSKAKQSYSDDKKLEISQKREQTCLKKYNAKSNLCLLQHKIN